MRGGRLRSIVLVMTGKEGKKGVERLKWESSHRHRF